MDACIYNEIHISNKKMKIGLDVWTYQKMEIIFTKQPHRPYSGAIPHLHPCIYTGTWMKRTWTKSNYNFISLNFNAFDHWLRSVVDSD